MRAAVGQPTSRRAWVARHRRPTLRDGLQSLPIVHSRPRRTAALHLNQDDLKRVAALGPGDGLAVMLTDRHKVDNADRFSPAFPENVTNCQLVRASTRRIRTFAIVTAH